MADRLARLRVIWVPHDFDADVAADRATVGGLLKERLTRGLLFAIVLGGVTSRDLGFGPGILGLHLAVIASIARDGFVNMPDLAGRLRVSVSTIRARVLVLATAGLLDQPDPVGSRFEASPKGKVVLDVCRALIRGTGRGAFDLA